MRTIPRKLKHGFVTYKTPIIYASSSIIKAIATVIAGFFIAKYVSPEDLGLWSTLSLFLTYALFLQGGVINGLNLELPLAFGEGKSKKARLYAGVAQTFTVYLSIILIIAGIAIYFFFPFDTLKIKYGVMAISLMIIATFYQNYLLSTFRSNNAFLKLSYLQIVEAIVNLLTIALVFYFSYYGMLLKAVIVLIVFVTILHFYRPLKVNLKWDKTVFLKLLKVGLPIFALAYLESFALTFDKILLIKYTSLKELGYYSFALYALLFSTLFSNALASYIYPKMTFKYGQDKNKLILWQYVKKITILLLLVQLPMFIAGYYTIPPAINRFFPNYIPSIVPMQILFFAGIMKGSVVGVNVIWSIKKWNFMILYQVSSAVFLFVFIFLFVNLYANKITGVAVGMLVANITSLITGIFLAYKATHSN